MSHPTWVRGLKLSLVLVYLLALPSHPTWVRGLKPSTLVLRQCLKVAPYVGAWIETFAITKKI